ncbi:MAG TPA: hypothetical protein VGB79_04460 [Allosphingosinicella sp.]|jgi:opacity protein-like surface antigen
MKKIILSIAAAAALSAGAAAPAAAQNRGSGLDNRIEALQQQIQHGVQRGTISRNEAQPLRDQLRDLTRLERQYSRGGFTRAEQRSLQTGIQNLRQRIAYAAASRNNGYGRR